MKALKTLSILWVVALAVVAVASTAFADDIEKKLRAFFPNLSSSDFRKAPIEGLYEVVSGGQVFYFHPDGYLIFGEIWTKDGVSLTEQRRQEIAKQKFKEIPLEKAVKIGNGKHKVIEFSDPNCPHCKKVSEFFSKREDVTRYIFFFPLSEASVEKIKYILCSKKPEDAYKEVFLGKENKNFTTTTDCEDKALKQLNEHVEVARSVAVRATPTLWVNNNRVDGANIALIEKFLKEGR